MVQFYRTFFSLDEVQKDASLQRVYWAVFIGFFISFVFWVSDRTITIEAVRAGANVCLPYFQNCENLYFLTESGIFSPALLYSLLTLTLVGSALGALRSNWFVAHALLWPAAIWKIWYLGVFAWGAGLDYEYFHLPVLMVFLFSKNKLYFSRLVFVIVYTLSATMKFDSSWITGSYFSSLEFGLPLFPNALIPFVTNGVALFEIFTPWLLLSTNRKWKNAALFTWIVFHIYSVQMVDFRYPLHCLAMIIALFYESSQTAVVGRSKQNLISFAVIAVLYILTLLPFMMPGDAHYNLKSMKSGVRMFDANHQCVSVLSVQTKDGRDYEIPTSNKSAMKRCAPYPIWFRAQKICGNRNTKAVAWKFHSSVNGGPFYTLVDQVDICGTEYNVFSKNIWFIEPTDGAKIAGHPKKNRLLDEMQLSEAAMIFPEASIQPSSIQSFLQENLRPIQVSYWILWILVSGVMLFRTFKFEKFR